MKHVFIIKPISKKHPFETTIKEVMKYEDYTIRMSLYKGHSARIIKEYEEPTRFYCVGGDGFLHDCIQSLVHTHHEVVVIPYGTGNDFSRMIQGSDLPKKVLLNSLTKRSTKIDCIRINDMYCINVACFGLDAVVANKVHVHGHSSYVYSLLKNFVNYDFDEVRIITKDEIIYSGPVTLCAFANGKYYGGGFACAPDANLTDGLMNVMVLPKINKGKAINYMLKIKNEHISDLKEIIQREIRVCDVYTKVSCNMDGEEVLQEKYHLEVVPRSINMVI